MRIEQWMKPSRVLFSLRMKMWTESEKVTLCFENYESTETLIMSLYDADELADVIVTTIRQWKEKKNETL